MMVEIVGVFFVFLSLLLLHIGEVSTVCFTTFTCDAADVQSIDAECLLRKSFSINRYYNLKWFHFASLMVSKKGHLYHIVRFDRRFLVFTCPFTSCFL